MVIGEKAGDPWITEQGWILEGWYTDSSFSEESRWDFDKETVQSDITLYAKWLAQAKNTLKVSGKTVPAKAAVLKKKSLTLAISKAIRFTNKGQGIRTYAITKGSKKITINKKTGRITLKKGLKKGTYKVRVKVSAAGNDYYKPAVKYATVTVKVK